MAAEKKSAASTTTMAFILTMIVTADGRFLYVIYSSFILRQVPLIYRPAVGIRAFALLPYGFHSISWNSFIHTLPYLGNAFNSFH